MRSILCAVFMLVVVASAQAQNPGATTVTGTASENTNKIYTFTSGSGQVTGTLSWDTKAAHLLMVLVCGSSDPLTFAGAGGLLDRFARFEAGVPGRIPCALGVSSIDETANYRLHVIKSADQGLTASGVASGVVEFSEARAGTLLYDAAAREMQRFKQAAR